MSVRRIVAYAGGHDLAASREFSVEALGMEVAMEDPVLDLESPDDRTAEIIIGAQEMQDPQPVSTSVNPRRSMPRTPRSSDEDSWSSSLTDEPWRVRRFFVEDSGGTIVNVLAHIG